MKDYDKKSKIWLDFSFYFDMFLMWFIILEFYWSYISLFSRNFIFLALKRISFIYDFKSISLLSVDISNANYILLIPLSIYFKFLFYFAYSIKIYPYNKLALIFSLSYLIANLESLHKIYQKPRLESFKLLSFLYASPRLEYSIVFY